ncbi:MAG: hypothetical protein GX455_02500 [Phycisphaerae bacterium]|nr:hypothetical protein [Phycisphaerae bacterium]
MLIFITGLVLGSCTGIEPAHQDSGCVVKDVISVCSPISFVCRASDWSRVGPARLTVTIRGLEVSETAPAQSKLILEEGLARASSIRLSNIQMNSYFRLIADVEVDGKDLAGILIHSGSVRKAIPSDNSTKSSPAQTEVTTGREISTRSASIPISGSGPSGVRAIPTNFRALLDRSVDLSSITPETSFRDALDRIRTSVEPALPMMINWNDLRENAFIDETSPVGLDGLRRIDIGTALELMCNAVDGGKGRVSYMQRGRVLVVASRTSLGNPKTLRIIDVSELTAPKSTGYGMNSTYGGYGSNSSPGYGMSGSLGNQLGQMMPSMNSGLNR